MLKLERLSFYVSGNTDFLWSHFMNVKKQKIIEVKTAADLQHLGGRFSSKPRQHGKHNVYFF